MAAAEPSDEEAVSHPAAERRQRRRVQLPATDDSDREPSLAAAAASGGARVAATTRAAARRPRLRTPPPAEESESEGPPSGKVEEHGCGAGRAGAELAAPSGPPRAMATAGVADSDAEDDYQPCSGSGSDYQPTPPAEGRGRRGLACLGTSADPEVPDWGVGLEERRDANGDLRTAFSNARVLAADIRRLPGASFLSGRPVFDSRGKVNIHLLLAAHRELVLASTGELDADARHIGYLARRACGLGLVSQDQVRHGRTKGSQRQDRGDRPARVLTGAEDELRFPSRPQAQKRSAPASQDGADLFGDAEDDFERCVKRRQAMIDLVTRNNSRRAAVMHSVSSDSLDIGKVRDQLLAPKLSFDLSERDPGDGDSDDGGLGLEIQMPATSVASGARAGAKRGLLRQQLLQSLSKRRAHDLVQRPDVSQGPHAEAASAPGSQPALPEGPAAPPRPAAPEGAAASARADASSASPGQAAPGGAVACADLEAAATGGSSAAPPGPAAPGGAAADAVTEASGAAPRPGEPEGHTVLEAASPAAACPGPAAPGCSSGPEGALAAAEAGSPRGPSAGQARRAALPSAAAGAGAEPASPGGSSAAPPRRGPLLEAAAVAGAAASDSDSAPLRPRPARRRRCVVPDEAEPPKVAVDEAEPSEVRGAPAQDERVHEPPPSTAKVGSGKKQALLSRMFERARQESLQISEPHRPLASEPEAEVPRADHLPAPVAGAESAGSGMPEVEVGGGSCKLQLKRLRAMRPVGVEGDECSGSGEEETAEEGEEASEAESAWSGEEQAPQLLTAFRERRALDEASRLHRQRRFEAEERTRMAEVSTATSMDVSPKRPEVAPERAPRGSLLLGARKDDESSCLYRFGARSTATPQRTFLQARTPGQACA